MARLNYKEYYPLNDPYELFEKKIKFLSDSDKKKWNNFKNRIVRSNFIKDELKQRQNNICPICSKFLNNNIVVHHTNYDNLCVSENYIKQKSPTPKKPNREINIPKCNTCKNIKPCTEKLVLIHHVCHMILHKQEGRISKNKPKISIPKEKREYEIVPREHWLKFSTNEILNLLEEISNRINYYSDKKHDLEFNRFFVKLIPENIIYFKPNFNSLTVTVSHGSFEKRLKELNEINIKSKIHKRSSRRLSFDISKNQYSQNLELINDIIKDCINKKNDDSFTQDDSQLRLF